MNSNSPWLGLFWLYRHLLAYRFEAEFVSLTIPPMYEELDQLKHVDLLEETRAKARASLTSVGIIFAFAAAVLGAAFAAPPLEERVRDGLADFVKIMWYVGPGVLLPGLVVWAARNVSRPSVTGKPAGVRWREYGILYSVLLPACAFLLLAPLRLRFAIDQQALSQALVVSGLVLAFFAVLVLLSTLEFYDAAAGWRGRQFAEAKVKAYFFHLASLGSASFSVGFCLSVIAAALLLGALNV